MEFGTKVMKYIQKRLEHQYMHAILWGFIPCVSVCVSVFLFFFFSLTVLAFPWLSIRTNTGSLKATSFSNSMYVIFEC